MTGQLLFIAQETIKQVDQSDVLLLKQLLQNLLLINAYIIIVINI